MISLICQDSLAANSSKKMDNLAEPVYFIKKIVYAFQPAAF